MRRLITRQNIKHFISYTLPLYSILATCIYISIPSNNNKTTVIHCSTEECIKNAESSKSIIKTANANEAKPPINQKNPEEINLSEFAKETLQATKERVDMMKESYDKLFAFIAALAALLAFLGFKGLESFVQTKNRSHEAAEHAEAAAKSAQDAIREAREAISSLKEFRENQYKIDNSAEINVSHGIILREIACLYRNLKDIEGDENIKNLNEFRKYLRSSLYYLNLATEKKEVAARILSRAYVSKGNVYNMLEQYDMALEAANNAIKIDAADHSAIFNSACYRARLSQAHATKQDHLASSQYCESALRDLESAIALNAGYKKDAKDERDFESIKEDQRFLHIIT